MILFAAKIIKVVLPLLVLGVVLFRIWHKDGQSKQNTRSMCRWCILWIILVCTFAVTANMVTGYVSPLKDSIVLTALGEKNEAAESEEVLFNGFTVDGKKVLLDAPEEGKWFWKGDDAICWRIETDSRQPEGVTRSITMNVPVGWSRTANFEGNVNCGLVEVKTNTGTQIVDTYAVSETTVSADLGRSTTSHLIINQIRFLVVYTVVLAALSAFAFWIFSLFLKNPQKTKVWITEHCGQLTCGGIALVAFAIMIKYANVSSLWLDELLTIDFTNGTIGDAIWFCSHFFEYHPPLFDIVATLWYHVAPYGECWLLMVCIVSCTVTVYIVGRIGELIKNKYTGVLAALFFATSSSMMNRQAFEYRPYAMLVMFHALVLYCFIRRNSEQKQIRWHVLYSLFLLCLGMTDYYGMIICAEFFLADVYLIYKKKIHWKTIFEYVFPGVVCFIWAGAGLIYLLRVHRSLSGWGMPTLADVISVLRILSGNVELTYWLMLLGIGIGVAGVLSNRENFEWKKFYMIFFALEIVVTIVAPIAVAKILNFERTIWLDRYFLLLIPCVCLLMGNAITVMTEKTSADIRIGLCLFLMIFLTMNCISTISVKSAESYRESADWIYEQDDIYNESTLIVCDDWGSTAVGYQEYYISRQGMRDELNVIYGPQLMNIDLSPYDKIYLLYCHYGNSRVRSYYGFIEDKYNLVQDRNEERVFVYSRK